MSLLRQNEGKYISGQEIADEIFVTRAAVWKAIRSLQEMGYNIEAVTNKGYRLSVELDEINAGSLADLLDSSDTKVMCFDEVTSTNDVCLQHAHDYNRLLVVTNRQSNGRGRRGREFYSPQDTGLYMSLLTKPGKRDSNSGFTAITAVAVATAIDEIAFGNNKMTQIKWVNDIFLDGKKVAGILCEMHMSLEDEADSMLITGIGINVYRPLKGFPKEIKDTAGTLQDGPMCRDLRLREKICAAIVNRLDYYMAHRDEALEIYRSKSMLIGHYVKINSYSQDVYADRYARVVDITENYHLKVSYDDGTERELSSGEVSVVKY